MRTSYGKHNITVIVLLLCIETLGFSFIAPIITPLFLKSHFLPAKTDLYQRILILVLFNSIYPFFMLISTPIFGFLSDKFGRKKTFLVCLIGTCVGYALTGIGIGKQSLLIAVIGRVIDGITAGSIPIAQASMSDISQGIRNKVKLMGLTVLGFAGGADFGAFVKWSFK